MKSLRKSLEELLDEYRLYVCEDCAYYVADCDNKTCPVISKIIDNIISSTVETIESIDLKDNYEDAPQGYYQGKKDMKEHIIKMIKGER